ncbi:phosphomannomutase [Synergistales bacterium]|nr:phosphomannomutase [Synergistales bacterium]
MRVSPYIFREYDIRGVADEDLTDETVDIIAKSFGTWLAARGVSRIAVGGDVRLSTERIRHAAISGLTSVGINIIDLGVVTTPMLYWSLYRLSLDGGVMITGSHNPSDMNGLKLAFGKTTIWGEDIQEVRRVAERGEFVNPKAAGVVESHNIADEYISMLLSKIKIKRKLKVVCDSGNGTAGDAISRFMDGLGCECVSLFGDADGRFPNHHPDPQKRENLKSLIEKVRETGADVGFAFDGDADRIGVVDERGGVIFGDYLMTLFWREILQKHPRADVIIEPKCSLALPETVTQMGGRVIWWKSGHSVIKAKMKEINALFAGELSGHMFFADEYYGFDDSFYAASRVLRIIADSDKTLSELMSSVPLYQATEEARIPCPDSEKFAVVERVKEKALKIYEGSVLDGVRIFYPDGWGLIRASNTQPVITTRCEGKTEPALRFIMEDVRRRITDEGLPSFEWTF